MINAVQKLFRRVQPLILDNVGTNDHSTKDDGSPVTRIDTQVEDTVLSSLRKQFPSVSFYGEEEGYDSPSDPMFWLIDPLDGTKSFIANVPAFTSMAILIQNGQPSVSIIFNHSTSDMFTAKKGEGAFKNNTKLDLTSTPLPNTAICKSIHKDIADSIFAEKGITCGPGPAGGGYGFTQVAEGISGARFQIKGPGYIHDYAPGALLVQEAGGINISILDEPYNYKSKDFISCHPGLADLVRQNIHTIRQLRG